MSGLREDRKLVESLRAAAGQGNLFRHDKLVEAADRLEARLDAAEALQNEREGWIELARQEGEERKRLEAERDTLKEALDALQKFVATEDSEHYERWQNALARLSATASPVSAEGRRAE